MTLPDLAHLQPEQLLDGDTWPGYRALIEDAIDNQPRTLQTRIGPSEIGTTCDACLVSKLAGIPEKRDGGAWLPFIGSCGHGGLEDIFAMANRSIPARYLIETQVSIGTVGGVDITGHADLFDLHTGDVTDWKVVGANTLKTVKPVLRTPARFARDFPTYRVQAHCYGRGFARRGLRVRNVQVAFLPRNSPTLADAVVISEPYQEQVALDAIARADRFATWITALGVDAVLASTGGHTGTQHSCHRFDATVPAPGHHKPADQLAGLIQTPDAAGAGSTAA